MLTDVTANNCGYTAFVLDNPGSVTMERCTGEQQRPVRDRRSTAPRAPSLTDCSATRTPDSGIVVYTLGTLDLFNATAKGQHHRRDLWMDTGRTLSPGPPSPIMIESDWIASVRTGVNHRFHRHRQRRQRDLLDDRTRIRSPRDADQHRCRRQWRCAGAFG